MDFHTFLGLGSTSPTEQQKPFGAKEILADPHWGWWGG